MHASRSIARAKVWAQKYSYGEIDAAEEELIERGYVNTCLYHSDCLWVGSKGMTKGEWLE